jgi:hypothetical protein
VASVRVLSARRRGWVPRMHDVTSGVRRGAPAMRD